MRFTYALDERPPLKEWLLFGLQWFAITIPTVIIMGKIVSTLHCADTTHQVAYLQKLCFVMGLGLLAEIWWGHRLPLVIGPAAVLLVGVTTSHGADVDTIYSSILIGGAVVTLVSVTRISSRLQRLFTPRVIAVVLLLIAFTLTPTILQLIVSGPPGAALGKLCFCLLFLVVSFLVYRRLSGIWKSTYILWAMLVGSLLHFALFPGGVFQQVPGREGLAAPFWRDLTTRISLDPGVLVSFLFCYLALFINDMGSIQSMDELLHPGDMPRRITRGMTITGLANILSGLLGVIGPVNYSLSPGVIVSTGCASRLALIPAGLALLVLSVSPAAIGLLGSVPSVVIGSVLLFVLCAQFAAGMMVVHESKEGFDFDTGLVLGLPILLGTIVAFLPAPVIEAFPGVLRPVLGNGFVVGVVMALVLEHGVFRGRAADNTTGQR